MAGVDAGIKPTAIGLGTGMMTEEELKNELVELLPGALNVSIPSTETDLFDEQILDSFGLVNLMFLIERHWGVKVTTDKMELDNFRSVDRIANFIESELTA